MAPSRKPKLLPAVVALCGSAADSKAIERFLQRLQQPDNAAVVIVLQHREALNDVSFKARAQAAGFTMMPTIHNEPLLAGKTYLATANEMITLQGGKFQVEPAEQRPGERGTVDSFLVSLAREEDSRAVAVLFNISGGDGTLGAAAIKDAGGLAAAEEGEERRAGDLSSSNSPAAIADFILEAEELADRIASHLKTFGSAEVDLGDKTPEILAAAASIATILRNQTGHDFHGYKKGTFLRRVHRRMQVLQASTVDDYLNLLRENADEVRLLFTDLLIGVTQFFRDPKEFELLERNVIPKLFEGKKAGDPLRIWVIGCSTGEEAYSLAILLREHMAKLDAIPHVQIFATDLDGRALAYARAGRYADSIANDVSPERLARWFIKEGTTFCIVKELREMCIFSQHSIIKDAPFSRLDLVSCRNLLIYLDADLQSRVIPLFHFALRSGGYLFLGNSENVSRHPTLFEAVENRSRIFKRLETAARTLPDFPFTTVDRRFLETAPVARPRPGEAVLTARAQRIADRYAPAYVITDGSYNIVHFSGQTGRYLEPANGVASLNLLNLVHVDLRLDLRAALSKAAEENRTVQVSNLLIGRNGNSLSVELVVEPIPGGEDGSRGMVVLFRDGAAGKPATGDGGAAQPTLLKPNDRIQQLEAELRTANERLQATVEELESTNEELKSSNEEYQSLNEELQSANEELETSKEELQSINEELTTVNAELAHRVGELGRVNSDLKNLLQSTQIATVFLDVDLRVTNFTPAAADLFHLVETDFGRPIAHIKSRISYDELEDDARRVLRTLSLVEREVEIPSSGNRYMVRVLPYRSTDNYIGGTVLTFTDMTSMIHAQQALRESEAQARLLLAELQHRVRNTLAVVRLIALGSAETSESVEDYAMHLEGRITAFARVQTAFTRNPAGGIDLELLVAEELSAHHAKEGQQIRGIRGPKILLRPKVAETLGLVVHELTTNAIKYGALSTPNGEILVEWKIEQTDDEDRIIFDWIETGVRLDTRKPRRQGFGTELIERMLAYELKAPATLDFKPTGIHCTISLSADETMLVAPHSREEVLTLPAR